MKKRRINCKTSEKLLSWSGGRGLGRKDGRKKVGRIVGYGGIGLLSLVMLALLFPIVPSTSQAVTADSSAPIRDGAKLKAETYVYSTLAVSLSERVNLDIVPKASGSFASGKANLKVTTNNTTGYAVYLQTGDNSSSLKPANGMIDAEIKPVVGEMSQSNFQNNLNTWGFAVGEANIDPDTMSYKAIPHSNDSAIITTDQLTAEDSYALGFATAVGADLPAGSYYNSVLVSVVANPIAVHTLSGITYMQEMSPYVCDYSDEHETKQLIDTRDGKSYWVAKLKDGNCWMTQNLALDIALDDEGNAAALSESGNKVTLDETNSDMKGKWSGASETERGIPSPNSYAYPVNKSWNLGKIVISTIKTAEICPPQPKPDDTYPGESTIWNSAFHGQDITMTCPQYTKKVDGWLDTYEATESASYNEDEHTYDAHYLFGNYYQFGAATGGVGGQAGGAYFIENSICPKGWQLSTIDNSSKSFGFLLRSYGLEQNVDWSSDIGAEPLYLIRMGTISSIMGVLNSVNKQGFYTTSTQSRVLSVFAKNYQVPSNYSDAFGFVVRCVAR